MFVVQNGNMRSHTPEIFAARGIVALDPPLADPKTQDLRSSCLTRALIDLLIASRKNFSDRFSLDSDLANFRETVVSDLQRGLDTLHEMRDDARTVMKKRRSCEWINNLLERLGPLAGQGVYLVNSEGTVVASALPDGLPNEARNPPIGIFRTRPYFQQAVIYRQRFVSDAFESIFNKNLTFTLCDPILDERGMFAGLLFAACQPGAWNIPLEGARKLWNRDSGIAFFAKQTCGAKQRFRNKRDGSEKRSLHEEYINKADQADPVAICLRLKKKFILRYQQ